MQEKQVLERAFAMPLTSPAYPPGPYRFVDCEYLIITYRNKLLSKLFDAMIFDNNTGLLQVMAGPDINYHCSTGGRRSDFSSHCRGETRPGRSRARRLASDSGETLPATLARLGLVSEQNMAEAFARRSAFHTSTLHCCLLTYWRSKD
jgi:hypothetical protein